MNASAITHTRPGSWEGCEPLSNDQRRAEWAFKYFGHGYHHRAEKPRIRLNPAHAPRGLADVALPPTEANPEAGG